MQLAPNHLVTSVSCVNCSLLPSRESTSFVETILAAGRFKFQSMCAHQLASLCSEPVTFPLVSWLHRLAKFSDDSLRGAKIVIRQIASNMICEKKHFKPEGDFRENPTLDKNTCAAAVRSKRSERVAIRLHKFAHLSACLLRICRLHFSLLSVTEARGVRSARYSNAAIIFPLISVPTFFVSRSRRSHGFLRSPGQDAWEHSHSGLLLVWSSCKTAFSRERLVYSHEGLQLAFFWATHNTHFYRRLRGSAPLRALINKKDQQKGLSLKITSDNTRRTLLVKPHCSFPFAVLAGVLLVVDWLQKKILCGETHKPLLLALFALRKKSFGYYLHWWRVRLRLDRCVKIILWRLWRIWLPHSCSCLPCVNVRPFLPLPFPQTFANGQTSYTSTSVGRCCCERTILFTAAARILVWHNSKSMSPNRCKYVFRNCGNVDSHTCFTSNATSLFWLFVSSSALYAVLLLRLPSWLFSTWCQCCASFLLS